ncbi:MAG: Fe-S cluster assembly protein SufB, partial [Candidatus Marinimicrobia bacterium]|nr:Fe-S cluster assembly protein SufB [Candidatus Neomarinimicrobiota bacterium]
MTSDQQTIDQLTSQEYKYGFVTDIEQETLPPGLDEEVVRLISARKNEPRFLLEWRLRAYRHWVQLAEQGAEPHWAKAKYDPIDYQDISYYSAPKDHPRPGSLDEVDPKLLETYSKLGIPLEEQKRLAGVAVDAIFDSVSVATTFK